MNASDDGGRSSTGGELAIRLDGFAWEALEHESSSQGVSVEELAKFALLYYLADLDSGRVSRRIAGSPFARRDSEPGPDRVEPAE